MTVLIQTSYFLDLARGTYNSLTISRKFKEDRNECKNSDAPSGERRVLQHAMHQNRSIVLGERVSHVA